MPEIRQNIEPYKLVEMFTIIREFEGNSIFSNTFICSTSCSVPILKEKSNLVVNI